MSRPRWFVYDPEAGAGIGIELYDTAAAAQAAAQAAIDIAREWAAEGWPDQTEQICWGEIRQIARIVARGCRGCGAERKCDGESDLDAYELRHVDPPRHAAPLGALDQADEREECSLDDEWIDYGLVDVERAP